LQTLPASGSRSACQGRPYSWNLRHQTVCDHCNNSLASKVEGQIYIFGTSSRKIHGSHAPQSAIRGVAFAEDTVHRFTEWINALSRAEPKTPSATGLASYIRAFWLFASGVIEAQCGLREELPTVLGTDWDFSACCKPVFTEPSLVVPDVELAQPFQRIRFWRLGG
jgi:hypothetical protein